MQTDLHEARPRRWLRASEVGQFVYCARAWWLGSVRELPSANTEALLQGTQAHHRHGRRVMTARVLAVLGLLLMVTALLVLLLA